MTLSNSIANDTTLSFLCSLGNITAITDCDTLTVGRVFVFEKLKISFRHKSPMARQPSGFFAFWYV